MEELEVLIKKQEQVEKDINIYQEHIDALSSSITNLKDKKQDFRYTYTVLKEEYDKVKDSENDADKQKAQELRDKMTETSVEYKNISNNLDSNTKDLDYIKEVLNLTETKNNNLKEQIANHPETKVVETTQLEKELQQKLSKAKDQKKKIEEGLNKEIKSISDIDHSLIDIIKNNPSYERYVKLLSKENEHLDSLENSNLDDKYKDELIAETKNKINSLESRQLAFAIDELRKESLKQDIIIDTAYDHIKELARSKVYAYDEIDSMRNGKVDQNSKDDKNDTGNDSDKDQDKDKDQDQNQEKNDKDNNTEKDNANDSSNQNNNKDKDENKNKKIDDDTETKAGKPAKRSFFKNIFSKASEIINKIKDRLPKSKAKKEQEQKEAEEKARKEQEQKEAEERARKEQEQKEAEEKAKKEQEQKEAEEKARKEQEQKEAEEKAKKEQEQKKYKNRHYDEHDFDDNEIYKKRVDEYLNNFEKKVKNAHKEAVRYREEHDFDDQNLN